MRLTPIEQQVIRDASLRYFGVRPRLFGSHVDDHKTGGDIDLYIKAPISPKQRVDARLRMVSYIWKALGERIPFADVLTLWERRAYLMSDEWRMQRAMRNILTHEYPEQVSWQAEALNRARAMGIQLIEWLDRLKLEFGQRNAP